MLETLLLTMMAAGITGLVVRRSTLKRLESNLKVDAVEMFFVNEIISVICCVLIILPIPMLATFHLIGLFELASHVQYGEFVLILLSAFCIVSSILVFFFLESISAGLKLEYRQPLDALDLKLVDHRIPLRILQSLICISVCMFVAIFLVI